MPNEQQNQSNQKPSTSNQGDIGKVGFNNDKAKPIDEKIAKPNDNTLPDSGKSSQYGGK